jgi:hypothetical protein
MNNKPGEADSLNEAIKASNFANGEKSPLEEKARTKGQRCDLAWEGSWFGKINSLCLKCAKDCKQSAKVKIVICPQFLIQEKAKR